MSAQAVEPSVQAVLANQLGVPGRYSKKFSAMVYGLLSVLMVFSACAVLFVFRPVAATSVVGLAQIAVTAISGLVSVYCGAQAVVDYKTTAALEKSGS